MSELGDLLELLHRGGRDLRTIGATLATWRDNERAQRAFGRYTSQAASLPVAQAVARGELPAILETTVRLWLERPGKSREETEEPDGTLRQTIRDGKTWWTYGPAMGAISNEGDESSGAMTSAFEHLFDPARLLSVLDLEPAGEGVCAGRVVKLVRAQRMPSLAPPRDFALHRLGTGADEFELAVDAEHGVLLRTGALIEGDEFSRVEVLEAAFNDALPAETFVFVPPEGEQIRPPSAPKHVHQDLALHELVAMAPFPILVPERAPEGWQLRISYTEASASWGSVPQARLDYRAPNGAYGVHIAEQPADTPELPFDSWDRPDAWREETRRGIGIRLRERPVPGVAALVRLERDGTRVQLSSPQLDLDALVGFAATLVRGLAEPPELT